MPLSSPADATKVHLDSSTDDPKQARGELADLVTKFNTLKNNLNPLGTALTGEGIDLYTSGGSTYAKVEIVASDSVSIDCGSIA